MIGRPSYCMHQPVRAASAPARLRHARVRPAGDAGVSQIIARLSLMLLLSLLACGLGEDRALPRQPLPCDESALLGPWSYYYDNPPSYWVMDFHTSCTYELRIVSSTDTNNIIDSAGPWSYSDLGDSLVLWLGFGEPARFDTLGYEIADDSLTIFTLDAPLRLARGIPQPRGVNQDLPVALATPIRGEDR